MLAWKIQMSCRTIKYNKVQLRSSDVIIDKATVSKHNITEFVFDSHDLLAEDTDVQASAR